MFIFLIVFLRDWGVYMITLSRRNSVFFYFIKSYVLYTLSDAGLRRKCLKIDRPHSLLQYSTLVQMYSISE
jgi:hypothetical protein